MTTVVLYLVSSELVQLPCLCACPPGVAEWCTPILFLLRLICIFGIVLSNRPNRSGENSLGKKGVRCYFGQSEMTNQRGHLFTRDTTWNLSRSCIWAWERRARRLFSFWGTCCEGCKFSKLVGRLCDDGRVLLLCIELLLTLAMRQLSLPLWKVHL